ncbi:hypothetical protein [Bacillus sp. CRN 9]|uniref:hypothetical protein n=1 Tax=Cytobacillus horneckiae TaxID=549687 RepID=UPI0015624C09|nr:hypothetical protein [Bacillus sp. CRN 9]
MFDPTAFENMKVVLEGHLYDYDLIGEISIIDRNDIVNTSKLSRQYELTFIESDERLHCQIVLKADLKQLAAELLPVHSNENEAGCKLFLRFVLKHKDDMKLMESTKAVVSNIWGVSRTVNQIIKYNTKDKHEVENEMTVSFNRLIYEDQMDDLLVMVEHMRETLKQLSKVIE